MSATPSFGTGLGQFIGAEIGNSQLENGINAVNSDATSFGNEVTPYNTFGQSFLDPTTKAINGVNNVAGSVEGYDQFMQGYTNTPAVQYQLAQADKTINSSAAANGGLLSGANLRALDTENTGIIQQGANTAYNEYLSGNSQQFGQLESALGNMFQAIGVGQTATGQQAGVTTAQMQDNAALAAAQARNDQGKGGGIGSMLGGLGSIATLF